MIPYMNTLIGGLFFISLLGYAWLLMLCLPKLNFGQSLITALCAMLWLAYVGVIILGILTPTAYTLIIGGLASFAGGLVCQFLNIRKLRKRTNTVGLYVYLLLALVMVIVPQGYKSYFHDDFSFWLRAVRELYIFDEFYINPTVRGAMYHTDYIPLFASLQYCVVRVFGWQDAFVSFPTFACLLSGIALLCDYIKKKGIAIIFAIVGVYILPVFGFDWLSIRADAWMLSLFTTSLIAYSFRKDNNYNSLLPIIMTCSIIAGTKIYSGLMMGAILCLAIFLDAFKQRNPQERKRLWLAFSLSVLGLLFMHFSWSIVYHVSTAYAEGRAISFNTLFQGNHRTGDLVSKFSMDSLSNANSLLKQAFVIFLGSRQVYIWVGSLLLVIALNIFPIVKKATVNKLFSMLLLCCMLYILGFWGSFFVQAETFNNTILYFATITTPLAIAILFVLAHALDQATTSVYKVLCGVALLTYSAMMGILNPPSHFVYSLIPREPYVSAFKLADDYYENYIGDQLTADDWGKHALLLECSEDASLIRSPSYKTHTYQYHGLPLRVTVRQFAYESYDVLKYLKGAWLDDIVRQNGYDMILLRIDDEPYWEAFSTMMGVESTGDAHSVYDIIPDGDGFIYECRK